MFSTKLGRSLLATGVALCVLAPASLADGTDSNGDVLCNGFAPATVQHDLIVPAGGACTILYGSTVKHDVIVNPGASLDDRGASVGHDITADQPLGIHVNGGGGPRFGSVGHNVVIDGATGAPIDQDNGNSYAFNSICNNVANDVIVENSASTAAPWSLGDRNRVCAGGSLSVGHDLVVSNNANQIDVEDNSPAFGGPVGAGIGHDLLMSYNTGGLVAEANYAGHDCVQQFNSPYTNQDKDNDGPNTAGNSVGACNTPNP